MMRRLFFAALSLVAVSSWAQSGYWQQSVDYSIDFKLNVTNNTFQGTERLIYQNNSPDTLRRVYFHLYLNAFQPNSDMDIRSRTIVDPDERVGSRIFNLKPNEIGKQEVKELTQDGAAVKMNTEGSILVVDLASPIMPGASTTFQMKFEGQVPLQIRRTGRDNEEGVRYSMSQWYPKMCAYDFYGWHANPYIGREFHGEWGNFDVKLTLDKSYVVAATGTIQNAADVGHGYSPNPPKPVNGENLTWHFKAERVHDFVWAADPDYKHVTHQCKSGLVLHFFYQEDSLTNAVWPQLPAYTEQAFEIMGRDYGAYPYPQYAVIQGGDGGMEYPMATLITGHRRLGSLVGVTVHELIHSWFQGMLATNEALYAWMDEGFTSFATHDVMAELFPANNPGANPHQSAIDTYKMLVDLDTPEPLTTHADHFLSNFCYGVNAYSKGEMVLSQLAYIVGEKSFRSVMKRYFSHWKFKHPTPTDFMRVAEKATGMELDWYFEYMVNTIHNMDYAVRSVKGDGGSCTVTLAKVLPFPMPLEVKVTFKNGDTQWFYIPVDLQRKPRPFDDAEKMTVLQPWHWVSPTYDIQLDAKANSIESVAIDPSKKMADLETGNNAMDAETIKKKPWEEYEK